MTNYSKTGFGEYAYDELTLRAKLFSFLVTFLFVVNLHLMVITIHAYNEVKSPVSGTSLETRFTVLVLIYTCNTCNIN